ncbi:Os08g0263300, partial [Oryza sativa Japonica Group]
WIQYILLACLWLCLLLIGTDEPGKQVRSAVKIKNISKSHIAFKVLSYVGGFQGGEGWILGGAGQCDQLRHGCSWQWDFDVDRESSAPALVVVLRELGCTPFISICRNLLYIRSFRIDLI